MISAGGVTDSVKELGLFGPTIITADNIVTIVGNNKISSDNIASYSATSHRRVDPTAKIANGLLTTPAPDVGMLQFTPEDPLLFVRPSMQPENYWQVYCDTNRVIPDTFRDAQYPTPETPLSHRMA